jgi:(S)-ureidoglycine aminohydrolase
MRKATAIVHASRARGASFVQYTAELEAGGELPPAVDQRFLYVLDGELIVNGRTLSVGDYAYAPPGGPAVISARTAARAAVFEKPYKTLDGVAAPTAFVGCEREVAPTRLGDDPGLTVKALVPDDAAFDFRVNTMTYQPGASLPAVEIHVMEHGLLMLEGGGIYRLRAQWYPVEAGDFIWMAPYCPQWFGALGKAPAKYLIYKDWDRHPR